MWGEEKCAAFSIVRIAVPGRVAIAGMKHQAQSKLGRKGLIWLVLRHHSSSLEKVSTET